MQRIRALMLALVLAACGGSVVPTGNGDGSADPAPDNVVPDALESGCADQLGDLISALEEIDGRLNVGLNYQDYSDRVGDASVAYERIDIDELGANCLERVGAPLEDALNAYINAYNIWNECIGDVDCDNDSITPDLQADWSEATGFIEEAQEALDE